MNDRTTVNLVVKILGAVALIGLIGLIALIAMRRPAADLLPVSSITTGALSAVGALLVSTKSVDVDGLQALADAQNTPPDPLNIKI